MSIATPRRSSSGKTSAALPTTPTDSGRALRLRLQRNGNRLVERGRELVEVAVVDPAAQVRLVDVDDEADPAVEGHGERLRTAHAAAAGGQCQRAGQRPVEPLGSDSGERLVRALQDALGADVDPGPGGHLPVHRQPEVLQPAELRPVGPVRHQVGVGDEHPRRPLVGLHDADRPAALHEQRLVAPRAWSACARSRRRSASRGRPARCRRRRRDRLAARHSRGRGCS